MLKKLLTLSLVAVMLSVTALAAPGGVMLMDATYAAEEVTEVISKDFEMIEVKPGEGNYTLTEFSENRSMTANYWYYIKWDISELQKIEEIKSVALDFGLNFGAAGYVYVNTLGEPAWIAAKSAIDAESEAAGETVTTATVLGTALVRTNSDTAVEPTATAAETFVHPKDDTSDKFIGSVRRHNYGNSQAGNLTYTLTGYDYTYFNDHTTSTAFSGWRKVTIEGGDLLECVKTAVEGEKDYLYLSVYTTNTGTKISFRPGYMKIKASNDVMVVYNTVYGDPTTGTIFQWPSATKYKGPFGDLTKDFRYAALVMPAGTTVKMLCAVYGEGGALLDVVTSDVLTVGTDPIHLDVLLSQYTTAKSVKCYLWDGETLRPYTDTPLENGASITTATE